MILNIMKTNIPKVLLLLLMLSSIFIDETISQTTFHSFYESDGLADNQVFDMAIGPDSSVWFATRNGVSKFHHVYGWQTVVYDTTSGLPTNIIKKIEVDNNENVFVFVNANGYKLFNCTDTCNKIYADDDLNQIRDMEIDEEGNVYWCGQCGAHKYSGNDVITFYGAYDDYISLHIDDSSNIWAASFDFIHGVDVWDENGDNINYYPRIPPYPDTSYDIKTQVWSIKEDPENNLWFSVTEYPDDGLVKCDQDSVWTTYFSDNSNIIHPIILEIECDSTGNLWLLSKEFNGAIDRFIDKFDGVDTWTTYNTNDGLASNWITDIETDCEGNIWVATGSGVSTTMITTHNDENNQHDHYDIYPNPNNGKFRLQSSGEIINMEILNVLGQKIDFNSRIKGNTSYIDMSGKQPGIYFLRIDTGKDTVTKKIILN